MAKKSYFNSSPVVRAFKKINLNIPTTELVIMLIATLCLIATILYIKHQIVPPKTEQIAFADSKFTEEQQRILNLAFLTAKEDGLHHPKILPAILLKETNAGNIRSYKVAGQEFGLKPNMRYYGLGQIKLITAKEVLRQFPDMIKHFDFHTVADEEVIAKLIENERFNIAVASKYLLILQNSGLKDAARIALAYNQGPTGAKSKNPEAHHYSKSVIQLMRDMQD